MGKGVSGIYSDTTDGVGKFFKERKNSGFYDDTTGGVEISLSGYGGVQVILELEF